MHGKTDRGGENRMTGYSTRLALCLGIAALLLSAAPDSRAESPHIYGFHSWSWGCDLDVMNGKTGWYVVYQIGCCGTPLWWLEAAKAEGFTIIFGAFEDWDEEIPPNKDDWPEFAAQCAQVADYYKELVHIYHLDNEMDLNTSTPAEFAECFRMVRDAIQSVQPEAIVTNGGTVGGPTYFPRMVRRLGAEIDGYQSHVNIFPHYMEALAGIPGALRKPYYITEFTMVPYDEEGWLQNYHAEIDEWNRDNSPVCAGVCWFVYELGGWESQSLKYLPLANADYEDLTANTDYTNEYAERPVGAYDVRIDVISPSAVLVSWKTRIASTTQASWHTDGATRSSYTGFDAALSKQHSLAIDELGPDTKYNLCLRSTAIGYGDTAEWTTFGTNTSWSPGGWLRAGWNLVSLPLSPGDPDAEVVFDTAVAAGNDITNNLFAYDGTYSIYPSGFTTLQKGKAYWLRLDMAGDEYCEGLNVTSDVEIALDDGWNLIGQPHDYPTPLADCEVSDGATTLSFGDAASAGWIEEPLYYYNNGYLACSTAGGDDALRPWYGYWLLASRDGLTLAVP